MQHQISAGDDDDEDLPDLPPGPSASAHNDADDDEEDEDLPPLPVRTPYLPCIIVVCLRCCSSVCAVRVRACVCVYTYSLIALYHVAVQEMNEVNLGRQAQYDDDTEV